LAWDRALELGTRMPPQRASVGDRADRRIGLVMDCDTGIEPDFARQVEARRRRHFKIINRVVPALRVLGYSPRRSPRSRPMRLATARSASHPASPFDLKAKGFTDEAIATVEKALPTAFAISSCSTSGLSEEFCVMRLV
jgi:ribonucleoside-diphosphate reductase alpha chain